MFNIGLQSESSRGSSRNNENERSSFTAGTWDTLDSLVGADRRLNSFNLDEVISSSNNRATIDTQGAVTNIFKQYSETALPEIFGAQGGSGAYGGSSAQLMANDAFARTVNQSAELQLGVASSYIGQALSARDQLIQQFSMLLQGNLAGSGSSRGSRLGFGTTTGSGRGMKAGLSMSGGGGDPGTFTNGGG